MIVEERPGLLILFEDVLRDNKKVLGLEKYEDATCSLLEFRTSNYVMDLYEELDKEGHWHTGFHKSPLETAQH